MYTLRANVECSTMMKRVLLGLLLLCNCYVWAQNPKREFRATWLTTHYSIDWPKTKATSTAKIAMQKAELTDILDKLAAANMNAFTFQVRALGDAMFVSSYEPWSKQLTGTRGQDPGYDPLAFAIEEGHKRGLEIHAWFNPFRYESSAGSHGTDDPIRKNHPDWLLTYDNGSFSGTIFDPGLPEVREYTVKVIAEVVEKYDIDGIIFDDYFYPYGGTTTEDTQSLQQYKPADQSDDDWRRENIDKTMKAVYDMIQEKKPWVRFGIAPFGIWTTDKSAAEKYGITLPSGITGMNAYKTLACNTIAWMQGGYVDYIAPQIYWPTTSSGQDYDVLSEWWSDMASHFSAQQENGKKIHFFSANNDYSDWVTTTEMSLEIEANRRYDALGAPGAIFYNTNMFFTNNLHTYLSQKQYSTRSLAPAMDWKATTALDAPTDLALADNTLSWKHGQAERFTVYAYPKGTDAATALADPANLLGVTWEKSYDVSRVSKQERKTFAVCAYDRYGNEYAHVLYNDGPAPEPEPEPEPLDGNVSITKLWSKNMGEASYLTGIENRSIAYSDDRLYIPTTSTKTFCVLDAADGTFLSTHDLGVSSSYEAFNVCVTADGQLLAGNSKLNNAITVYAVDKTNGGAVAHATDLHIGRADYFSAYGDWSGEGYLLSVSNDGTVAYIPFKNGELRAGNTYTHTSMPSGGISVKVVPLDETSFLVNSSVHIPTQHDLATGELVESFGEVEPKLAGVSGMASFMLSGNRYLVTPADACGSLAIFDITQGLAAARAVVYPTESLGTNDIAANPATVAFAVHTVGNDAYIYVLAPNNGIAAYKMTFAPTHNALEDVPVQDTKVRKVLENGQVVIIRDGVRYNVLGNVIM